MEQDRYRLEQEIEWFAEEHCREYYQDELESYIDMLGIDKYLKKFDERIEEEGDSEELREGINDVLEVYANVEPMPDDYPIENYKKWANENHSKNYSFKDYVSDYWTFIEEEYYKHMDEVYDDAVDKIEDVISDFVLEYDELRYDMEQSRSWCPGRYPSVYFHIYKYDENDEKDERVIRVSDGHNNGTMSQDYEVIFDEYQKEDLMKILDEILFDLDIEEKNGEEAKTTSK